MTLEVLQITLRSQKVIRAFLKNMDAPFCLERDHSSITVAWEDKETACTKQYELEIFENGSWRSLSDTIRTKTIRKKNLLQSVEYLFRIRSKAKGSTTWSSFSNSSEPAMVLSHSIKTLSAPTLSSRDSQSLTIQWVDELPRDGYKLRYRADTDHSWQNISSIVRDKVVRKKGLKAGINYLFSVCPVGISDEYEYSASSLPYTVTVLTQYVKNLLPTTLLCRQSPNLVPSSDALAGKTFAIYFSAHWCGPCRSFTPKLAAAYNELKSKNKNFEVIFCSADHNEADFKSYYKDMPFLAISYDDEKRESFMDLFKVSGIPKLVVLAPSGRIISDSAAGQDISMQMIDKWIEDGAKL